MFLTPGIFINIKQGRNPDPSKVPPFSNHVYIHAAVLDPSFAFRWLDHDTNLSTEDATELKRLITDDITTKAKAYTTS